MADLVACQVCGGNLLSTLLDMGAQPVAERYTKPSSGLRSSLAHKRYPLVLQECKGCTLVQLSQSSVVDPHIVFPPDHPYSTGNSASLREHFRDLAHEISLRENLGPGDLVVDIGANDGTLLEAVDPKLDRVAVEPTGQAQKCVGKEITVYQEFFSGETASCIKADFGKSAKVIVAANVLAHVPDPHDFLDGVTQLLAWDGVFITENHHVSNILDGFQIDTIYHEHLRYFSVESLAFLLGKHGLTISEVTNVPTHGGSFRVSAHKSNTGVFRAHSHIAATALFRMIANIRDENGNIYGIGATTRATPLIQFTGIAQFIDCIVEVPGSDKIGMMMPGTEIHILDEAKLFEDQPSHALLFSWHMADVIVPKLRERGYKGQIIIPLPYPRIIDE